MNRKEIRKMENVGRKINEREKETGKVDVKKRKGKRK